MLELCPITEVGLFWFVFLVVFAVSCLARHTLLLYCKLLASPYRFCT